MSLEATLIMMDNSAYALNGDYLPTRWQSQVDAVSLLIQAKIQSNMQSSVGLGLMGGRQVQILCTLTSDSTKINSYLFGVKIHGELHLTQALQVGALALKHRLNETQKQRLVCFVGSTIAENEEKLRIFAKKLKKNQIAVDLVCFGDCSDEQKRKVETFMNNIQQDDNSHFMFIEPGQIYLSEKLLNSPLFSQAIGPEGMGGMGGGLQEVDPELAEAIRLSLAENQQPQPPSNKPPTEQQVPAAKEEAAKEPTQQELQQLAIRLSLEEANKEGDKEGNKDKMQEEGTKKPSDKDPEQKQR